MGAGGSQAGSQSTVFFWRAYVKVVKFLGLYAISERGVEKRFSQGGALGPRRPPRGARGQPGSQASQAVINSLI